MRAPDQSDTEQFELTAVQNSTKKDLENGNAHSQNGNTIKNLEYRQQRHDNEPESDDDDFDHGQDEGSRALLGSQDRTRGRERIKNNGLREVWPQAKNIVIEVCLKPSRTGKTLTIGRRARQSYYSQLSVYSSPESSWTKYQCVSLLTSHVLCVCGPDQTILSNGGPCEKSTSSS